jgi:hypothetical protein
MSASTLYKKYALGSQAVELMTTQSNVTAKSAEIS